MVDVDDYVVINIVVADVTAVVVALLFMLEFLYLNFF